MHLCQFLFLQIHWKFKCPKIRAKTFRQIKYRRALVYFIHFASFRLFSSCFFIFLCKITHECIQFLLTLFSIHSFGLYGNSLWMCICMYRAGKGTWAERNLCKYVLVYGFTSSEKKTVAKLHSRQTNVNILMFSPYFSFWLDVFSDWI